MQKIKQLLMVGLALPVLALAVVPVTPVSALGLSDAQTQVEGVDGLAKSADDPSSIVKNFINFMLYVIGILSVAYLIWGGIRYTTSAGDSNKVTAAKNTIMYAVIGLVVAILAYAIVNLVITQVKN